MMTNLELVTEAIYDALANHHRINWSQAEDAARAALTVLDTTTPSAEQKVDDVGRVVCEEIKQIMQTYREQEAEQGYVDTPGGLEHMGDVWRLLSEWDDKLRAALASSDR